MNPILIQFLNGANGKDYEIIIKGLILFWWFFIMPSTITAICIDELNIIYNKAIIQTNNAFPKLINHWKNPLYHCSILLLATNRILLAPIRLLLACVDGKEKWWNCL